MPGRLYLSQNQALVIDQNGLHSVVKHEQIFPRILHLMFAQVVNQPCNCGWLSIIDFGWDLELVLPLV